MFPSLGVPLFLSYLNIGVSRGIARPNDFTVGTLSLLNITAFAAFDVGQITVASFWSFLRFYHFSFGSGFIHRDPFVPSLYTFHFFWRSLCWWYYIHSLLLR